VLAACAHNEPPPCKCVDQSATSTPPPVTTPAEPPAGYTKPGILVATHAASCPAPPDFAALERCVEATPTGPGYGKRITNRFEDFSNQRAFEGSNSNIGVSVSFAFFADEPGLWSWEFALDSGVASGARIDDQQLFYNAQDIWTGEGYEGAFTHDIQLERGWHVLTLLGVENCCDGVWRLRFKKPSMSEFLVVDTQVLKMRAREL
jgi:hypothetical protein